MAEANLLIEAFGLDGIFYKDMDIFYVKMPNNKVEKHYFKVNDKGLVQIYDSAKSEVKNPQIKKAYGLNIEARTKRMLYGWQYGSDYVLPLFSEPMGEKFFLSDDEINSIFNRGMAWADLIQERKELEDRTPMILIAIVIIGLLVAASLFLDYQIADKMGIISNLFPKGA